MQNLEDHTRNNIIYDQIITSSELDEGKILFIENKIEEALTKFQNYQNKYGLNPEVLYLSGLCYLSLEQEVKYIESIRIFLYVKVQFSQIGFRIILRKSFGESITLQQITLLWYKYKDNELEQSKIEFSFAHKLLPNKIEPLFYKAIIKIKKYCSSVEKSNEENRINLQKDGLDLLELALKNFLQSNLLFYKGILHFALGNLEKSSLDLEQAIEKSEDNQAQHYYVRGLLHCQLQLFKQAVKQFFNLFKFRLKSFRILSKQMQIINYDGEQYSINYQTVGIYFYKGLFYTYLGQYSKVKQCLCFSYDIKVKEIEKSRNDQLINLNNLEDFDFTNKTYNIYEQLYNCAILDVMLGNVDEAFETLTLLHQHLIQIEFRVQLQILMELLRDDSLDTSTGEQFSQIQEFQLFSQHNRLCSIYPAIQLSLKKYSFLIWMSFCLPIVEFPSQPILFDEQLLQKIQQQYLLDIYIFVENKPEALWIKKSKEGVIFTDSIQCIDDLDFQSTVRKEEIEEIQQEITYFQMKMIQLNQQKSLSWMTKLQKN